VINTTDKIKPIELNELMDQEPSPLIIDVRDKGTYELGHIPSARNIPEDELIQVLDEPPLNRQVVVYCDMKHPGSSRSEAAAQKLREVGYDTRVLDGGFPAWSQDGYDVEAGDSGSARLFGSSIH
jgi:rhodanese-related sulfurtransferase